MRRGVRPSYPNMAGRAGGQGLPKAAALGCPPQTGAAPVAKGTARAWAGTARPRDTPALGQPPRCSPGPCRPRPQPAPAPARCSRVPAAGGAVSVRTVLAGAVPSRAVLERWLLLGRGSSRDPPCAAPPPPGTRIAAAGTAPPGSARPGAAWHGPARPGSGRVCPAAPALRCQPRGCPGSAPGPPALGPEDPLTPAPGTAGSHGPDTPVPPYPGTPISRYPAPRLPIPAGCPLGCPGTTLPLPRLASPRAPCSWAAPPALALPYLAPCLLPPRRFLGNVY